MIWTDQKRQIFGHVAAFNCFDDHFFQSICKFQQFGVVIQFGAVLTGAILTEKVFARPGIGTLLLEAIQQRDYPVVQGVVLLIATTYVLVNLATDLLYAAFDPRVRLSR